MKKTFLVYVMFFVVLALHPALYAAFIAIVDAGSSGSRINLFNIKNINGTVQFDVIPLKNNKTIPGVSGYALNPDKIAEHISPLIESLRKGLPSGVNENDVALYFFSTAGMRTVNPAQQELIHKNLENYLKANTNLRIQDIGTISGKMEGVFDWIALNCLKKKFNSSNTVGVIDIGGGSIQVAYEDNSLSSHTVLVKIGSASYFVHSHSYLGIGADLMRSQFTANANCFPKGLRLSDVTGTGDFDKCLSALRPILTHIHNVESIPPAIIARTKFIGITNFYYVTNSKAFDLGAEVSLNDIKTKGKEFARMTWQEMKAKWPGDQFLYSQYIYAAFLIDFIEEIGFDPNTKLNIVSNINGLEVSWALGAAVYYAEGNN